MSDINRESLEILLKHWAEHNNEHSEEFRRWAEIAKSYGKTPYDAILAAAQQMDKANEFLKQALDSLKKGKS